MSRLLASLFMVSAISGPLSAQTIAVRLLDAKTGKPIADKNITFHWNTDFVTTVVRIGKDGTGHVDVPKGATGFRLMEGPKDGSEPNRVAYFDCNAHPELYTSEPYNFVSVVLAHGVVPGNTCSKKAVSPDPGVIVFWALTRRWSEPDMQ